MDIFMMSVGREGFISCFRQVLRSELRVQNAYKKITKNRIGVEVTSEKRDSLSHLSEVYYWVAKNSFEWIKNPPICLRGSNPFIVGEIIFRILQIPFWFLLGLYCCAMAFVTSEKVFKVAGGYGILSAQQCVARQRILRSWRRWDEAISCIEYGLSKNPRFDSAAYLFLGKADVLLNYYKSPGSAEKVLRAVYAVSEKVEKTEPVKARLIYREYYLTCKRL